MSAQAPPAGPGPLPPGSPLPAHAVTVPKLVLLSLASLGIYELVWFYRHWRVLRERGVTRGNPLARALFSPLFAYPLFHHLSQERTRRHLDPLPVAALALAYVGLVAVSSLPDPWWLVSVASVLPVAAVQARVNELHERLDPTHDRGGGFGPGAVATVLVGLPLLAAVAGLAFGPPTRAVRGDELRAAHRDALVEAGLLAPEERILWLYCAGLFSVLEEGNLLTERRVVSWEDTDAGRSVAESPYEEIAGMTVTWSDSALADTHIEVQPVRGEPFALVVSTEDGRDHDFVAALERARERASPPRP